MTLPIVFKQEAQAELDVAYAKYEGQRTELGEEFMAAVRHTLERVQHFPELYAVVPRNVRRETMPRFPHGIYYRVQPGRIEVVAIYYGRRQPQGWWSRL